MRARVDATGWVIALPAEARSVGIRHLARGGCARWHDGWLALSGPGRHAAMRAAERLLACGVTRLASWGVAGALDDDFAPGDVLVPDRIAYRSDDIGFATDVERSAWLARTFAPGLRVRRGVLWSAAQPVATCHDKRELAARSGAQAVDMEAAAVAAVALRAGLPFVAVKAICDPLDRELPARIVAAFDAGGRVTPRLVASIATGGPAVWRAARTLARDFARARHALATAARLLSA